MSKRISAEERILDYFQTADLNKVEVVYNLVRKTIKERQVAAAPVAVKKITRKPRAKKVVAPAAAEPMTAGASAA